MFGGLSPYAAEDRQRFVRALEGQQAFRLTNQEFVVQACALCELLVAGGLT